MCGIIGFSGTKYLEYLKGYFEALEHRGKDSYGVLIKKKRTIQVNKSMKLTDKYIKNIQKLKGDYLIGHNRWASVGNVNIKLAHPITKKVNQRHFSIIHNGTKKTMKEAFDSFGESDTEVMCEFVGNIFLEHKIVKEALNGAGVVFVISHQTEECLVSIDGERPLFINAERDFIASEPIFEGTWYLVENHFKMYDNFNEFLEKCPVNKKSCIVNKDEATVKKCPACGKKHYIDKQDKDERCYKCAIIDKEVKKISYTYKRNDYYSNWGYSYSNTTDALDIAKVGVAVEFQGYPGCWYPGVITAVYGDEVAVKCLYDDTIYPGININEIDRLSPDYLIQGREYDVSDDGNIWHKRIFVEENKQNSTFIYKTKLDKWGYSSGYKYVKVEDINDLNL